MARKLNTMTLLQQAQGLAEITRRCPRPQAPGWVVAAVNSWPANPRLRLTISIDVRPSTNGPDPVTISHVR